MATEPERIATRRAALDTIPAQTYPRTTETAATVAEYFTTEQFLWGLDRVLDGLEPRPERLRHEGPHDGAR